MGPWTCAGRIRLAGATIGAVLIALLLPAIGAASPPQADADDPPYSVDLTVLDAALDCDEFTHPDTQPVLLVHGTSTTGHEQFDWNYAPALRDSGHDVCIVTYPDRGLGDMQISAEYIARAVQRMYAESGRPVDMVGHSQGALMPRWSLKYWPSVRDAVDDFVLLAGPNHGSAVAGDYLSATGQMPAVFHQFMVDSAFISTLNEGDETPGEVSYTSIYSDFDELVRPIDPPTAALDPATAAEDPQVTNIGIQDLCPARTVDHLTIGTTDALTMRLVVDALDGDGPADALRAGVDEAVCNLADQFVVPESFLELLAQVRRSLEEGQGSPEFRFSAEEPPLRSYAAPADQSGPTGAPTAEDPTPQADPEPDTAHDPVAPPGPEAEAVAVDTGDRQIARTGQTIPILAAGVAIAVALLLRIGSSRIRNDPGDDVEGDLDSDEDA